MPTDRSIIAVLCLLLAGCGTNVMGLLGEESRTYWRAEPIIAAAEEVDPSLDDALFAAESEKDQACESINAAASARIFEGEPSFGDRLWSDLTRFFVRLFPVESVERCAEAHERYNRELVALRRRLEDMGVDLSRPDHQGPDDEVLGR